MMMIPRRHLYLFICTFILATNLLCVRAFSIVRQFPSVRVISSPSWKVHRGWQHPSSLLLFSSFASDGSEYAADRGGGADDDEEMTGSSVYRSDQINDDEDETPTIELQPVPLSKNSGNRFVAVIWDRKHRHKKQQRNPENANESPPDEDVWDWHEQRIEHTEDHVMFCRKQNLYNETFNTESMVDILWSLQILSSDLQRVIGHAMCLESTALHHVKDVLAKDPIIQNLEYNVEDVDLYRWRHIRDYTLRMDDGRDGYPCLCVGMDYSDDESTLLQNQQLREDIREKYLETLIRSERIIATGPLYLPTEFKNDPSSLPVGDLILFNAKSRPDAIDFVEHLPSSQNGLYETLRVHFYNTLDITGKFVSEDPLRDAPCEQMKEAMEYWGYPVSDEETPWLNW